MTTTVTAEEIEKLVLTLASHFAWNSDQECEDVCWKVVSSITTPPADSFYEWASQIVNAGYPE